MNPNTGPAGPQISAQQAAAILAAQAASIGRFQAPELFFSQDVALTAPTTLNVPRPLNLNRPAESMTIIMKYRITVANANLTAVFPEAPQTLLQQILLNGTHRRYGNLTPIRMTGATAFAWQRQFQNVGCDLIINGVRAADPGRPFVSPFLGNVGTYDVIAIYNVPFAPMMGIGQSAKRDIAAYLYQPADWGDTLQLQLGFGDATALGTPVTAGDATLTAFGSAAGSPNVAIHLNYSILGEFANRIDSGVCIRNEQLFTSFVTAGTSLRLSQLQKQITSSIVLKTGTAAASLTAGVNAYATLVDTQLDRTQIMVDNKPVRNNQSNFVQKDYLGRMFNTIIPAGYFPITFVDGQSSSLAYRGDGLAGGSLFEVWSDVLTTGATQQLSLTQEMIYGGPFPALRPA